MAYDRVKPTYTNVGWYSISYLYTSLHGVTFQKALNFINSTMGTSVIAVFFGGGGANLLCIVFTKIISDFNVKSRYGEMRVCQGGYLYIHSDNWRSSTHA